MQEDTRADTIGCPWCDSFPGKGQAKPSLQSAVGRVSPGRGSFGGSPKLEILRGKTSRGAIEFPYTRLPQDLRRIVDVLCKACA